ncbi:MAG: hypothetical protein J0I77_04365 [Rudaea sp.]|uniref:amidase family protein n=1 Tax=unclassified Rudaea TaxID=2627037 RepID=UPI0010F5377B|nr:MULTISPECIES: amidase family protein [unclassified Rudaea]MBN8884927.1 hypothetical protein [Rudaea sp.]
MTASFTPLPLRDALALGLRDAHAQAALVHAGEVSMRELAYSALQRIDHLDAQLGAVCHRPNDLVEPTTGGAFAGVPWLAKDSLAVPGMPTRSGSRSRTSAPAQTSHAFARCWQREGLVAVGKSTMPEFGLMGVTEPLLGPVTRNPWQATHSPGGSSGGAGAALAAGLVPLAHGSDGAGSIRIPASCCGVVGLKPGRGTTLRVRGRHALEDLLVGDSLMSRSVRDTAWAFAAAHPGRIALPSPEPGARLRIAVIEASLPGLAPDPEVAAALAQTAALCERLGHRVEQRALPIDGESVFRAVFTLWSHLGADCVEAVAATLGDGAAQSALEPFTLALARWNREHCGVDELEHAYAVLAALPHAFAAFHADWDVLLSPVLKTPPPLLGELAPTRDFDELMPAMFDWMGYTPLQNLAGTPAISLPLAQTASGLPIGLQFAADRHDEPLLLALAHELEQAAPWHDRWPPISVAAALQEIR